MDRLCNNTEAHDAHAWTPWLDRRGLAWCPGKGEDVNIQNTQLLDAGVPLEQVIETAITKLAITAERGGVTPDWRRVRVTIKDSGMTVGVDDAPERPIKALRIDLPGERR